MIAAAHPAACSCLGTIEEWWANYAAMIRRYLLARMSDQLAADECTSETFLRAMARRHRFQCGGDGVRPWLFTIARNIAHDYQKRACRRYETPVERVADRSDPAESPEDAVVRQTLRAALNRCIDELPDDQGRCVRLRFIDGLSVEETARVLGRSEGAVKALQHRGIRNLARGLTGKNEPHDARRSAA